MGWSSIRGESGFDFVFPEREYSEGGGEGETPLCWLSCRNKFRTVDPKLADSLDPFVHHRHMTILSLFYNYYFGRCSNVWKMFK